MFIWDQNDGEIYLLLLDSCARTDVQIKISDLVKNLLNRLRSLGGKSFVLGKMCFCLLNYF